MQPSEIAGSYHPCPPVAPWFHATISLIRSVNYIARGSICQGIFLLGYGHALRARQGTQGTRLIYAHPQHLTIIPAAPCPQTIRPAFSLS